MWGLCWCRFELLKQMWNYLTKAWKEGALSSFVLLPQGLTDVFRESSPLWVHRVPLGLGRGCSRSAWGLKDVIHLLLGLFNIITQTLAINSAKVHHTLLLINLSLMTGVNLTVFLLLVTADGGQCFQTLGFQDWRRCTCFLGDQVKAQRLSWAGEGKQIYLYNKSILYKLWSVKQKQLTCSVIAMYSSWKWKHNLTRL